jgi:hypothetical protein
MKKFTRQNSGNAPSAVVEGGVEIVGEPFVTEHRHPRPPQTNPGADPEGDMSAEGSI